ncbi:MAG: hypothetical protein LUG91_01720 [Ruminococcus sp.]|nr:hypothetical protein [Ruminococcus sp.]
MSAIDTELKKLLQFIPDSYNDFVIGTPIFCRNDENKKRLIDFIKEKKCENLTTTEIMEFMDCFD